MLRLNPSLFAASVMLSALSLGCSAMGRITASLCRATPQAASPAIFPLVCFFAFKLRTNFIANFGVHPSDGTVEMGTDYHQLLFDGQ
jgi:hypothetical protein